MAGEPQPTGFALAAAPTEPVATPAVVRALARGRPLTAVWQNQLGGITWTTGTTHIKWNPHSTGIDLTDEANRLRWATGRFRCPTLVDTGENSDGQWLVTETITGHTAIAATGDHVAAAVVAIAEGQRHLHHLSTAECPFTWSVRSRRDAALARLDAGDIDPRLLHPQHQHLTRRDIVSRLEVLPDPDPVVCHGDPCAPNTLIAPDGSFAGVVDLGSLGVGDRWADLAVAIWSLDWNFGSGWTDHFLDAYGSDRNDDLMAWHQLLWDLG